MRFRLQMHCFQKKLLSDHITNIPLRWVLVVPFVLQTVGAVVLVGYLSYRSGQEGVKKLADHVMKNAGQQVTHELDDYLPSAHEFNQRQIAALESGVINVQNLDQLHRYLILQHRQTKDLTTLLFGTPQGDLRVSHRVSPRDFGVTTRLKPGELPFEVAVSTSSNPAINQIYSINEAGDLMRPLDTISNLDVHDRLWYRQAVETGKAGWTKPFQIGSTNLLALNAYTPFSNKANQLLGVFAVNISLNQLGEFLSRLEVGQSGEIYIIERNGLLIANSTPETSYSVSGKPDLDGTSEPGILKFKRRLPSEISNPAIQDSYQYLKTKFSDFATLRSPQSLDFRIHGNRYFLTISPYNDGYGLDWLVVTVIPESDFITEVQSNKRTTGLLCLLTLGFAIGSGLVIANQFIARISRLNRASQKLANGDLSQRLPADSCIAEVKLLAQSFNRMADQLQQSFDRLQNALEDSEEKYKTIFRTSPDAIAITNLAEGRFLEVNNRMIEFYGYSRAEMIGRTPLELGLWVNVEQRQQFRQRLETQGYTSNQEVITRTQSGEIKVILVSAEVCNLQGQDALIIVIRDISERKQAQEALRQSEERFQQLAAACPGVIYTVIEYPTGPARYEYVSPAFEEIHEIPIASILGDAGLTFHQIHPEDREGYQQAVEESIKTWKPFKHEWRIITPSGKVKWIQASSQPEQRENGEIAWHGVALEISDRKQIEEQLRRTEQWLQQYSRQSPSSIYTLVLEPDGRVWFEYASSALETIHEVTQVQALLNADFVLEQMHPDDVAGYLRAAARSMESLELFSHEWRIITPSGQLKWLRANSQPEQRSNGAIAWHGVIEDISDRKQLELALQCSEASTKNILNSTIAAIASMRVFKDNTWKIDQVSAGCERMTGYTAEELVEDNHLWINRIEPEDWLPLVPQIFTNIFAETTDSYEYRFYHKDGSVLWISQTNNSCWDEVQQCWVVTAISVNITDRKQAEIALQQNEARLKEAQRVAKVGNWEFDVRTCESLWSEQMFRITGLDPSQPEPSYTELLNLLASEDREELIATVKRAISEKTSYEVEHRICRPNGSIRYVVSKGYTILDPQQQVTRLYGTALDITDRKLIELALKAKTEELDRFFSLALDLLCIADTDGYFHRLNSQWEKTLGYNLQELEGSRFLDYVHPDDIEITLSAMTDLVAQKQVLNFVNRYRCRDNSYRWIEWRSFPAGDVIYAAARDITERKQTEIALKQSETRFLEISESSPANIYIFVRVADGSFYFEHMSRAIETIHEIPVEQILDNPNTILERIHPDDQAGYHAAVQRSLETLQPFQYQWRIINPSGKIKWLQGSSRPVLRDNGDIAWYGIVIDITDRRQAELALRESEQKFKGAFDTIITGMSLVSLAGGFQEVNRTLCQMLGYSEEELLGMGLEDVIHPLDQGVDFSLTEKMMKGEIPGYQVEKRFLHKDGYQIWGLLNLAVMRDPDGGLLYLIAQITDISDRKQAELELQRQKDLRETIYNEATDALFLVDPDQLVITDCNQRAVELFEVNNKAELIGLEGRALQRRPFTSEELDEIVAEMEQKGFWSLEIEYITRKGNFFWGNLAAKIVQIANQSTHLVRVTDISAHKQAEQELQQAKEAAEAANQAKSVFLANMSHELRTPLNVILGFTQLMNRDTTLTPDGQNSIKIMHSSGKYLLKLINEILELSKIEAGKLTVEKQAIDLFDLLESLQTTFSQRVKNKKLKMYLEVLPEVPQYIIADDQKLQQVLINLIGNAIKFTETGSVTLRVGLGNEAKYSPLLSLCFEVEDTGVGIASQDLNRIFDAFVQASSGQQAREGTGLGLSISSKLVQLMGGEITARSMLGKGSIFGVTIPVQMATEANVQPQQLKRRVTGLAPDQPSYRILVVDDRVENRLLLVKLLEQLGLEVKQAASGEEAVLLWQQWHPHLIWMDLRMPGLDGYEATQRIRASELKRPEGEPGQPTIIIALTAQASVGDRKQALAVGCDDYISKPFETETLFSKMAEHLGISYTYTEDNQMLPDDETLLIEDNLTSEDFAVMPSDWVIELYQASRTCEQQAVKQLIQQIPPKYSSLVSGLEQLNQGFDFEKIMELTQIYFDSR